jgi:hypothetical protein
VNLRALLPAVVNKLLQQSTIDVGPLAEILRPLSAYFSHFLSYLNIEISSYPILNFKIRFCKFIYSSMVFHYLCIYVFIYSVLNYSHLQLSASNSGMMINELEMMLMVETMG